MEAHLAASVRVARHCETVLVEARASAEAVDSAVVEAVDSVAVEEEVVDDADRVG